MHAAGNSRFVGACPAGSTRQGWSSRLAEEEQAFGAAGALDGQGRGLVSMTTICPVLGSSTVMAWAFCIWVSRRSSGSIESDFELRLTEPCAGAVNRQKKVRSGQRRANALGFLNHAYAHEHARQSHAGRRPPRSPFLQAPPTRREVLLFGLLLLAIVFAFAWRDLARSSWCPILTSGSASSPELGGGKVRQEPVSWPDASPRTAQPGGWAGRARRISSVCTVRALPSLCRVRSPTA